MRYEDLTIDQKIGLKGEFQTNEKCVNYRAVWLLYGFITAINYFLTDDINILHEKFEETNSYTFG